MNDTVTKKSINNKYSHYSEKEAKSKIYRLFPKIWTTKLKPSRKRMESSDISNPEALIPKLNPYLPTFSNLITTGPQKHKFKAGSTTKGVRRRNSENTRDKRILDELARNKQNKQTESSSGELEDQLSFLLRERKSVKYADRENSEEEEESSSD